GDERHARLPAPRGVGAYLGPHRQGRRHPLLRRADRADRHRERSQGPPAAAPRHLRRRRRPAVAHAPGQAEGAGLPARARLRPHRKKDIIISGGENISTIEVEQAVARHPAVMECAVVAVPDEKWGERPKAFVTLKPGMKATEAEVIEFCRQHIAHFKCPAAVEFGDLPKTSTGKVQKFVLRDKEWKGRAKRIN